MATKESTGSLDGPLLMALAMTAAVKTALRKRGHWMPMMRDDGDAVASMF